MRKVPSLKPLTLWEEQTKSSNLCSGALQIVAVVSKSRERILVASTLIVFFWNANRLHVAMDNDEFS